MDRYSCTKDPRRSSRCNRPGHRGGASRGHGAGRGPAGHTEALEEAGSLGDGDGGEIIEEENYHTAHEEVEWELDPAMVERFAKTAERLEKRRRDRRAEQQASRQSLSRAGKSKKKKKKQKKKRKSGTNAE